MAGCGNADADALVAAFAVGTPNLDIWRRWPDVSASEDAFTDSFACEQVSHAFTIFARDRGWDATTVIGDEAETPFVDYHVWSRLFRGPERWDVDWTVRQYHNLHGPGGRDPKVLDLPWPLMWQPALAPVSTPDGRAHPVAGRFGRLRSLPSPPLL